MMKKSLVLLAAATATGTVVPPVAVMAWAPNMNVKKNALARRTINTNGNNNNTGGSVAPLKFIDHVQQRVDRPNENDGYMKVPLHTKIPLHTSVVLNDPTKKTTLTSASPPQGGKTLMATSLTWPYQAQQQQQQQQKQPSQPQQQPSRSLLIVLGCLLAANSGFLNGLTLQGILGSKSMACAAVTGAWTNSALKLSMGNFVGFVQQFGLILAYAFGSFCNGLLHPHGNNGTTDDATSSPLARSPTLLYVASLVLLGGSFFQSIPLLAMANGWQNSWTSMLLKGNVLRTSHFSGITSDLGTFLGQIIGLKKKSKQQQQQQQLDLQEKETLAALIWKVKVQSSLVLSFFLGGLASVVSNATIGGRASILACSAIYVIAYGALQQQSLQQRLKKPRVWWSKFMRPILRKPLPQPYEYPIPTPAPIF